MDAKQLSGKELEDAMSRVYAMNDEVLQMEKRYPEIAYRRTGEFNAKNREWGEALILFAANPTLDNFQNVMSLARYLIFLYNSLPHCGKQVLYK